MLFFKINVKLIQLVCSFFWNVSETEFQDFPCSVILMLLDFKFAKLNEICFIDGLWTQINDDSLEYFSCCLLVAVLEFEFRYFKVGCQVWTCLKVFIKNVSRLLWLTHALLELNVPHPSLFSRHPLHPSPEDISCLFELAQNLFHVRILEPKLIFSW